MVGVSWRGLPWELHPKNRKMADNLADKAETCVGSTTKTKSCARTVGTKLLCAQIRHCEVRDDTGLQSVYVCFQRSQVGYTTERRMQTEDYGGRFLDRDKSC